MAETVYNIFKYGALLGNFDLEADTIRALLFTGSVTIDPDHATVAAVVAANTEASDGSYARVTLTTLDVAQNDTNDRAEFDADDIDFGALDNETPTAMLIYQFITDDAGSDPIAIFDTNFGDPSNGAGYVVQLPNKLLRLT